MSLRTKIIGVLAAIILTVTGCGSDTSNDNGHPTSTSTAQQSTNAPSSGNPCAKAEKSQALCSNKEVTETNCDGSQGGPKAFSAKSEEVQLGTVTGSLAIRKANPAQCKWIFWGLYVPNEAASKGAFKVTTQVGNAVADQVSEPGNDIASAWTEGLYASEGAVVKVCLAAGGQEKCIETTSV